nr:SWIM zinc finger family protein [Candidatus Acetothermia bacterium]
LSAADWKKLAKRLSQQALFAAKLLSGEMPQDIEKEFTDLGLSLFPARLEDLETDCSCPDWSNPCKHIAAVYYLLGEEFNRDPFLIFKLRGMGRTESVKLFGATGAQAAKTRDQSLPTQAGTEKSLPPEPLAVEGFWEIGKLPDDLLGEVRVPPLSAALPKRLGNFPFWRGEERFLEALEPLYAETSSLGLEIFLSWR